MKNYRLTSVHHDNIDCIHIRFNGGEEMYIPVADIQAAIEQHQHQPPKQVMKRAVIDAHDFLVRDSKSIVAQHLLNANRRAEKEHPLD